MLVSTRGPSLPVSRNLPLTGGLEGLHGRFRGTVFYGLGTLLLVQVGSRLTRADRVYSDVSVAELVGGVGPRTHFRAAFEAQ